MMDLNENMGNHALQILKRYLHYHIAYGHQTWKVADLP